MGNYVSCTLTHPMGRYSKGIKVILPNGEIRKFHQPIKAAELMLESPSSFLVNSRSLRIGARFSALSADEDLEIASVYVMFPMNRINSVIATGDLGAVFLTAKRYGSVRVTPENVPAPRLSLEDIEEFSSPEFKLRVSMCRSKKPLLDTIDEEPICSR